VTRETGSAVPGNRLLAAQARDLASRAARGSVECKAVGCAAVLLGETRTVAAGQMLAELTAMVTASETAS
jgi:hypothetical protein